MNVLVVDDDPEAIGAFVPLLKKALPDANVHGATDGRDALGNADALGRIDVLVTDVVMGEVDGFSLRDIFLSRFPGMKTVFVTGYDLSEYSERIGSNPVFQKPVDWAAVGEAILSQMTQITTPEAAPVAVPQRSVKSAAPENRTSARTNGEAKTEDPLVGCTLGGYEIIRQLGAGRRGPVYEGNQISINRPVAIKVLTHELQNDPDAQQQFMADAAAKATVRHPGVLGVFEAGESDGWCFYSREFVDGENIAEMTARGEQLDELMVVRIISGVARAMSSFHQHQIPHGRINPRRIYIGADKRARLSNIATAADPEPPNAQREILTLSSVMGAVLPPNSELSPELQKMLARMRVQDSTGFVSWGALLQEIRVIEPKVLAKTFKPNEEIEAAIRAFEAKHRRRKLKSAARIAGVVAAAFAVVAGVIWKFFIHR